MEPHKRLALYHTMVLARAIERRLWTLDVADSGSGGFEAVQVAAAAALRPGLDWVVPYHRDLALCLAMGLSPLDVMLGLFGRAEDPASAGRAPAFSSRRSRIVTTSGLTGTQIVHAAGIAYASKLKALDEVTLASIGDRGTDSGDWHEGLNFAAVHRLPLVCLVQDNAPRAVVPPGKRAADVIALRADGYGMAGESIDGTDFAASFDALTRAVDRARSGRGPTLVHARVVELTSLTPRGSRQSQEQMEAISRQDPIDRMRRDLHDSQLIDDASDDQIHRDCITVVEAAIDQARSSSSPEPASALDNVYGVGTND
ncbi:MAG: thiamine pyrophosphate-dependent enzyme [Candidatus Dormibacteraeota bacterium]|nr:thiamine pyrophosphate-dependent enzyme [Candidatus Dormibacteraeota bacterium]